MIPLSPHRLQNRSFNLDEDLPRFGSPISNKLKKRLKLEADIADIAVQEILTARSQLPQGQTKTLPASTNIPLQVVVTKDSFFIHDQKENARGTDSEFFIADEFRFTEEARCLTPKRVGFKRSSKVSYSPEERLRLQIERSSRTEGLNLCTQSFKDEFFKKRSLEEALNSSEGVPDFAYATYKLFDGDLTKVKFETMENPIDFALTISIDFAKGLYHLHRAGLLHRDIKPQNLLTSMQTSQGAVGDFGCAKPERSSIHHTTGTPEFLDTPASFGSLNDYLVNQRNRIGTQSSPSDVRALGIAYERGILIPLLKALSVKSEETKVAIREILLKTNRTGVHCEFLVDQDQKPINPQNAGFSDAFLQEYGNTTNHRTYYTYAIKKEEGKPDVKVEYLITYPDAEQVKNSLEEAILKLNLQANEKDALFKFVNLSCRMQLNEPKSRPLIEEVLKELLSDLELFQPTSSIKRKKASILHKLDADREADEGFPSTQSLHELDADREADDGFPNTQSF